jgi:hypothetical protein
VSASRFELNLAFPADPYFAATARDVVVQAARQSGVDETRARTLAEQVEAAARASLDGDSRTPLTMVVRLVENGVEIVVNGRIVKPEPA